MLKVGKSVVFNQKIKRMQISFEDLKRASANFTTAGGLFPLKSYINMMRLTPELGIVCQFDEGHSVQAILPAQVYQRIVTKFTYRWINYNRPSVYGTPVYENPVQPDSGAGGIPQFKSYQIVANTAGANMDIDKLQSVNINPAFGCDAAPFVPYANPEA